MERVLQLGEIDIHANVQFYHRIIAANNVLGMVHCRPLCISVSTGTFAMY